MGDVVAAGTPIILLHGLVDNGSIFVGLRRALRRRQLGRVITLNYSPFTHDVRDVAHRLAALVAAHLRGDRVREGARGRALPRRPDRPLLRAEARRRRAGAHRLHARHPPHRHPGGAPVAAVGHPGGLRPASDVMAELAEPVPGCPTRFVAFWSDKLDDPPPALRALRHRDLGVRNVLLHGAGHLTLPILGHVVHEITTVLAHLDADGHTVTAGVTPLARDDAGPRRCGRTRRAARPVSPVRSEHVTFGYPAVDRRSWRTGPPLLTVTFVVSRNGHGTVGQPRRHPLRSPPREFFAYRGRHYGGRHRVLLVVRACPEPSARASCCRPWQPVRSW